MAAPAPRAALMPRASARRLFRKSCRFSFSCRRKEKVLFRSVVGTLQVKRRHDFFSPKYQALSDRVSINTSRVNLATRCPCCTHARNHAIQKGQVTTCFRMIHCTHWRWRRQLTSPNKYVHHCLVGIAFSLFYPVPLPRSRRRRSCWRRPNLSAHRLRRPPSGDPA